MNKKLRKITWNEILLHKKINDCWIVIDNYVVDVSKYINKHPGGSDIILEHKTSDVSIIFDKVCHSNQAYEKMLNMVIGIVDLSSDRKLAVKNLKISTNNIIYKNNIKNKKNNFRVYVFCLVLLLVLVPLLLIYHHVPYF